MIHTCRECTQSFDDARQWCTCPHPALMSDADLARKKLARAIAGKPLRFAHEPQGPVRRVTSIKWNGMVEIDGLVGEFAPHLFIASDGAHV